MKWSKLDVERFKASASVDTEVISVEGNVLIYSYTKKGTTWTFKARLTQGGKTLSWSTHILDDCSYLLE
jgi:hypothetical protein